MTGLKAAGTAGGQFARLWMVLGVWSVCFAGAQPIEDVAQAAGPWPEVAPSVAPVTDEAAIGPTYTRSFKVSPNTFLDSDSLIVGPFPRVTDVRDTVRGFFEKAGIDFSQPTAPEFFFNDRTGVLLVRGTEHDIELVETTLKNVAAEPAHVRLEVRLAEISDSGSELKRQLQGLIGERALEVMLPSYEDLSAGTVLRKSPPPAVLTEAEMRQVFATIEKRPGIDLFVLPSTTTKSGRQVKFALETHERIALERKE